MSAASYRETVVLRSVSCNIARVLRAVIAEAEIASEPYQRVQATGRGHLTQSVDTVSRFRSSVLQESAVLKALIMLFRKAGAQSRGMTYRSDAISGQIRGLLMSLTLCLRANAIQVRDGACSDVISRVQLQGV